MTGLHLRRRGGRHLRRGSAPEPEGVGPATDSGGGGGCRAGPDHVLPHLASVTGTEAGPRSRGSTRGLRRLPAAVQVLRPCRLLGGRLAAARPGARPARRPRQGGWTAAPVPRFLTPSRSRTLASSRKRASAPTPAIPFRPGQTPLSRPSGLAALAQAPHRALAGLRTISSSIPPFPPPPPPPPPAARQSVARQRIPGGFVERPRAIRNPENSTVPVRDAPLPNR